MRDEERFGIPQSGRSAAIFDGWRMVAWQLLKSPSRLDAALARISPTKAVLHALPRQ
jgi:hypothetical protein